MPSAADRGEVGKGNLIGSGASETSMTLEGWKYELTASKQTKEKRKNALDGVTESWI